jgi:hypothetical protein
MQLVLQLIQGGYLDQSENILLVGPSSTVKSLWATALGMAACALGRKVRFFRVTELITQLLEAKEERQLLSYRKAFNKLDLLVLDELGYVPASIATHAAAMQCEEITVEAADNGHQIAGILHDISIGCGLLLDGIGTIGDGGSIRHVLLL